MEVGKIEYYAVSALSDSCPVLIWLEHLSKKQKQNSCLKEGAEMMEVKGWGREGTQRRVIIKKKKW